MLPNVTVGKIAIATISLLLAIVYCEWLATRIPIQHYAYGIGVNFIFLAAVTVMVGTLKVTSSAVSYFSMRGFERNGRIYRWVGIRAFASLLRLIGWDRVVRRNAPIKKELVSLLRYSDQTKGAEAVHAIAAIITAGFTFSIGLRYPILATKWLWLVNILVNVYPVMLQRYNRPRVERLILRLKLDSSSKRT